MAPENILIDKRDMGSSVKLINFGRQVVSERGEGALHRQHDVLPNKSNTK